MISARRTLVAVVVSVLLVATAVAATWLMASAGVFNGAEQPLPGAPQSTTDPTLSAASGAGSAEISSGFFVAQPRDPFEPLIEAITTTTTAVVDEPTTTVASGDASTTTVIDDGATSTTVVDDGSTTTTASGDASTTTVASGDASTTSVVSGDSTTTTVGDSPDGIRVVLLEIREEDGLLVAVAEVGGETHTVGVGDTFGESFKVVSLTETGGVFTFGDSAFTLAVGQTIFK